MYIAGGVRSQIGASFSGAVHGDVSTTYVVFGGRSEYLSQHRPSLEDLYQTGERTWNLTRIFNLKAGMTGADEDLPSRLKEEPLPDGPAAGHLFTDADIDRLLSDYYAVRGWEEHGVPLTETLRRLAVEYTRP